MASRAISSRQIDGEKVEAATDFTFLGSEATADADCSHEIKKMLAPWKESCNSTLKSRDIALLPKACTVKLMVFPGVTYRCETWTIQKAERRRIDAFELWCWRRLLRVPWTARR